MAIDQRRFERTSQPFDMRYRQSGFVTTWTAAMLLDLSAVGLRMQTEEPVEEGVKLEVELRLPNEGAPLIIGGLVIWVRPGADESYESGLEFQAISSKEEAGIDALVEFLKESEPPPEKS